MTVLDADRFVDHRRRTEKAKELARVLWPKGDADRPPIEVVRGYSRDVQKMWEKAAGVRTSHPDELWGEVVVLLEKMQAWEQENQVIPVDRLVAILSAPVKPKAPVTYQPGEPAPVCILRCLCGGHVPKGRHCPEHPNRWVNPTPDPTRTLDALKARGAVAPPTGDRYGPPGQVDEPPREIKKTRRRR